MFLTHSYVFLLWHMVTYARLPTSEHSTLTNTAILWAPLLFVSACSLQYPPMTYILSPLKSAKVEAESLQTARCSPKICLHADFLQFQTSKPPTYHAFKLCTVYSSLRMCSTVQYCNIYCLTWFTFFESNTTKEHCLMMFLLFRVVIMFCSVQVWSVSTC